MSEDEQLLSKISRLAGHINRQRDKPRSHQRPIPAGVPRQLGSPGVHRPVHYRVQQSSSHHRVVKLGPVTLSNSTTPEPILPVDGQIVPIKAPVGNVHRISHEGLQYIVAEDGRMLLRDTLSGDATKQTPQYLVIHGVKFEKNKHGHLIRQNPRGTIRSFPPSLAPSQPSSPFRSHGTNEAKLCKRFTATGRCPRGPRCTGIHNAMKVAICRDLLNNGHCARGGLCDLSHQPSYERVPACVHFLRGSCSKENCVYPHVTVDEMALVCDDFARIGFCEKGVDCPKKHVFECPDYSNTGKCKYPRCRLPHIDKAAMLRQRDAGSRPPERNSLGLLPPDDDQDMVSSDEEVDFQGHRTSDEAASRQEDFIPLG